jgi:hypothetical protein
MPAFQGSGGVGSTVESSEITDGTIVNVDISATAGIIASKLSGVTTPSSIDTLTNKTIDQDGTGNSITNIANASIKTGASIDYSKLNLTGNVLNADLAGSIANTKLATDPLARGNHTGTQTSSTVSDLATTVKAYRLDEFANPTSSLDFADNFVDMTRIATPINPSINVGRIYIKQIDASNDGIYITIKKAGSFNEVQIA